MNLGKILICVHFGLSLVFFAWALALFVTRVDFSDEKATAERPAGELVARQAELTRLVNQSVRPTYERWYAIRSEVAKSQTIRASENEWYRSQLLFLREGDVGPDTPILQVLRGDDGQPFSVDNPPPTGPYLRMDKLQDKTGKPLKARSGKDFEVRSLKFYDNEMARMADLNLKLNGWDGELKDAIALKLKGELDPAKTPSGLIWDIMHHAARDKMFTMEIAGLNDKGEKVKKGLQARLLEERGKRDRIERETEEARSIWLNQSIELKNLEELRQRLDERIKELSTRAKDAE